MPAHSLESTELLTVLSLAHRFTANIISVEAIMPDSDYCASRYFRICSESFLLCCLSLSPLAKLAA